MTKLVECIPVVVVEARTGGGSIIRLDSNELHDIIVTLNSPVRIEAVGGSLTIHRKPLSSDDMRGRTRERVGNIVEFETGYQMAYEMVDLTKGYTSYGKPLGYRWTSRISVDLTWIVGAQPSGNESEWTSIMLAGSNNWTLINYPYDTFMTMWMAVRAGMVRPG